MEAKLGVVGCGEREQARLRASTGRPSLQAVWPEAHRASEPFVYTPYRLAATGLVWVLVRVGATPSMVSMLSVAAMMMAAVAVAALPGPRAGLAFLALSSLSFTLDCTDGTLARVTRRHSLLGHRLDVLSDSLRLWLSMSAVVLHEMISASAEFLAYPHLGLAVGALYLFHNDIGGKAMAFRRDLTLGQGTAHGLAPEPQAAFWGQRMAPFIRILHNAIQPCVFYVAVGLAWSLGFAAYVYGVYIFLLSTAAARQLAQIARVLKRG